MRVKVLGCVSPICTKEDNLSGYLVTMDKEKILLDCGSGITREMNFPEDLIDLKIIVTHLHPDHYVEIFNIANLIKEYKRRSIPIEPIDLYIPGTPKSIYRQIKKETKDILIIKKYNEKTKIKGLNHLISFCKVKHGDMESYAVKIFNDYNSFVYTGDASNIESHNLIEFSKGTNAILADASLLRTEGFTDNPYHMTVHEASNYARIAEAGKLILTHFNSLGKDDNKIVLEAANNFQNIFIAKTGNVYNIW